MAQGGRQIAGSEIALVSDSGRGVIAQAAQFFAGVGVYRVGSVQVVAAHWPHERKGGGVVRKPDWQSDDGAIQLYCGDCLELLPEIEAGSVDAVVTDPPYAIPTIVAACRKATRNAGDLSLIQHAFKSIFGMFDTALASTGRFFVFCDGTSYPVVFNAAYGQFGTALLIWDKGRIGMGREFRKSHELVLHAWKSDTPIFSDGVGRADVMRFKPVGSDRQHDAEKPVDLIENLLTVCGRHILDPFAGSFTTAVACIRTGRRCIAIEKEPKYFEIGKKRCQDEITRTCLFN